MSTPLKKGKKTLNFFLPLNYHWKYYQAYCWDDINNPAYDRPNPQFHEDPLYWLPSSFQNLSNNTDRNGANKKNTNIYTHSPNTQRKITIERVSWCENKWYPNPPPLFHQPLPFYGENLNPLPLSLKILKIQNSPFGGIQLWYAPLKQIIHHLTWWIEVDHAPSILCLELSLTWFLKNTCNGNINKHIVIIIVIM